MHYSGWTRQQTKEGLASRGAGAKAGFNPPPRQKTEWDPEQQRNQTPDPIPLSKANPHTTPWVRNTHTALGETESENRSMTRSITQSTVGNGKDKGLREVTVSRTKPLVEPGYGGGDGEGSGGGRDSWGGVGGGGGGLQPASTSTLQWLSPLWFRKCLSWQLLGRPGPCPPTPTPSHTHGHGDGQ